MRAACRILVVAVVAGLPAVAVLVGPLVAHLAGQTGAGSDAPLAGTTWQLVRFEGGDGAVVTPDDGAKYTLAFLADGAVSARIDCNRGRGTWKSPRPAGWRSARSR